ncbi:MAG: hypothetical protein HFI51_06770 [Lachnospiraceae bacterium]|nr:hypothetical protein [Lachnospiraceae bacterium]
MVIGLKKWKGLISGLLCTLFLTGCGEDEALNIYQKDMETFFEHMAEFDENMNAIDVGQEDYVTQLLSYLDALDAEVAWMAELEVPEQFAVVEDLADEASENMRQAVSYFHMAYEAEEFMPNYEEAAREYYKRANLRIQYIIMLLHGEIPEGEGITYTEEDKIFGGGYLNKTDEDSEDGAENGGETAPENGAEEGAQE